MMITDFTDVRRRSSFFSPPIMIPPSLPANFAEQFNEHGFAIVEKFLSPAEVDEMRSDMAEIVDELDINQHRAAFDAISQEHARSKDNYFINSADTVGYFLEKGAINEDGTLKVEKQFAINKIGHGLHLERPTFRRHTMNDKTREIAHALGFRRPAICQSMYIFKQPFIGDTVVAHQDATFLYVDPPSALVGIWIALNDADRGNGCLWFAPGSHKLGLIDNNRFVRTVDPDTKEVSLSFTGPWPMPGGEKRFDFVPAEVKAGDAVVIHGTVVHKSEMNTSEKPRNIYTFHLVETEGVLWDKRNWLQPIREPFARLY